MLDRKAIATHLEHLRSQIDDLAIEMAKGDDEYSPLMSWESFQQQFDEALSAAGFKLEHSCICSQLGAPAAHRCSMREKIVEAHMNNKRKVAV